MTGAKPMTTMTYYQATGADGHVEARGSVRTYAFAVLASWPHGRRASWSSRADLAQGQASAFRIAGAGAVEIVPAVEISARDYRAIKGAAAATPAAAAEIAAAL